MGKRVLRSCDSVYYSLSVALSSLKLWEFYSSLFRIPITLSATSARREQWMRCVNTKNTRLFDADKRITFAANHMIYGNKVANVIPHFLFLEISFGDRANYLPGSAITPSSSPLSFHLLCLSSHRMWIECNVEWGFDQENVFFVCDRSICVCLARARVASVIITITRCRHGIFQFQSFQLTFFTHWRMWLVSRENVSMKRNQWVATHFRDKLISKFDFDVASNARHFLGERFTVGNFFF